MAFQWLRCSGAVVWGYIPGISIKVSSSSRAAILSYSLLSSAFSIARNQNNHQIKIAPTVLENHKHLWASKLLYHYDYNELDSNWLELDCIIEVPSDDICCELALYKKTDLNWISEVNLKHILTCKPEILAMAGEGWKWSACRRVMK